MNDLMKHALIGATTFAIAQCISLMTYKSTITPSDLLQLQGSDPKIHVATMGLIVLGTIALLYKLDSFFPRDSNGAVIATLLTAGILLQQSMVGTRQGLDNMNLAEMTSIERLILRCVPSYVGGAHTPRATDFAINVIAGLVAFGVCNMKGRG